MLIIVSGLPRSGTSMMMKMFEAGGLKPFVDNIRKADPDNPKGYYEFERVKQLENDKTWLPEARGKVVKVISALLKHLPPKYVYKIVFMEREMAEILASQKKMLIRRGNPEDNVPDERLARMFQSHLNKVKSWIAAQPNIDVIYINYNKIVKDLHDDCIQIHEFLDKRVDIEKMADQIDTSLYRQRH